VPWGPLRMLPWTAPSRGTSHWGERSFTVQHGVEISGKLSHAPHSLAMNRLIFWPCMTFCMDYEPHDMVLHATSSHSKQTSDFTIVELVKSLSRTSSSLLVKSGGEGERKNQTLHFFRWLARLCAQVQRFSAAFTQQVTRLSSEGSAHVVVLAVDSEIAPSPYGPRKGSLIDLHEPAGSHDGLGNSRQGRKCWVGHTRRLVAAGTRLIGTLLVGMSEKRLGELSNL
jgi:hypothetical protein